jgi:type 1 glutamine amidotransferase
VFGRKPSPGFMFWLWPSPVVTTLPTRERPGPGSTQWPPKNISVLIILIKQIRINEAFLSKYQLIIQLDYVPYAWKPEALAAFEKYIDEGKGGWVGFHHATLLGEFDGYKIWPWFSDFMGGIRYKNYIGDFAAATVKVENSKHPIMKGVPASFPVQKEEWYIYDKSPRPNVEVIASVDESTYKPDSKVKMGDHPVIWSNPDKKAKNVYIFMGHSPVLFESDVYKTIFKNAILWAAQK